MNQFFASGGQSTGVSASASVLPMNTQDWSPLGWTSLIALQSKGLSRVFFNKTSPRRDAQYIIQNGGLDEAQARIKIARRNINNLRDADDTTLMVEIEEELTSLLMKVKEESEKVSLQLNIQKTKIMASGPITSQQIDGETVETVTDFILWAPKSV